MSAPDQTAVETYLGETEFDTAEIGAALLSEKAAQARACRVPADDAEWPADLAEALCRRVARNLAVRRIPLGYQPMAGEWGTAAFRIGADAEVRRLEAPWRRLVVG